MYLLENEHLFELMSKIYSEITEFKSETLKKFDNVESTIKSIENQSNENALILEKIQTDVKTLAEVEQSFSQQLSRSKVTDGKSLDERLDIIELSVSHTAKSISNLTNNINIIKDTTISNELDIKSLKKLQHKSIL